MIGKGDSKESSLLLPGRNVILTNPILPRWFFQIAQNRHQLTHLFQSALSVPPEKIRKPWERVHWEQTG